MSSDAIPITSKVKATTGANTFAIIDVATDLKMFRNLELTNYPLKSWAYNYEHNPSSIHRTGKPVEVFFADHLYEPLFIFPGARFTFHNLVINLDVFWLKRVQ